MRKDVTACIIALFLMMALPTSIAKPAVDTDSGPVFGGQHSDVNNASNQTSQISLLPAVAEDFTATWCQNCVKVEHALDDLEEEGMIQKYEFHVSPNLDDSPFGSDEIMQHLNSRYGIYSPPLVAINGTTMKEGSLPESDSLINDYREMIALPLNLGNGFSTFGWTPQANCSCDLPENTGIISWDLDADLSAYPNATLSVNAWIVEGATEFSDGSNGQGTYYDVVTDIIELGNDAKGIANISIPTANDGDDLEIHLIYLITLPEIIEQPEIIKDEDAGALPGFGIVLSLVACLLAATMVRREHSIA